MSIESNQHITNFSSELTEKDHEFIRKQCELQHATSPEEIAGFTLAYQRAKQASKNIDWNNIKPEEVLSLVHELSVLTDETKNQNGFRSIPVTFASGNRALDPANIERAMQSWAESYAEGRGTPEQLYKEFEDIHPFQDGNGRVGDLLWKIATQRTRGDWPEALPPDLFGKDQGTEKSYQSAFGEVEE